MITQNLNPTQKEELRSFYSKKVAQLQFQVLKMRRSLAKRQAQEQKWLEDLANYQKRKTEGEAALQVLSESNPYYHKIKLDAQKCEIKIIELEIRLQRFTLVQKAERITKIMALEASISYYQDLIIDLENAISVKKPQHIRLHKEQQDVEVNRMIAPVIDPFKAYISSQKEWLDLKRA